MTAEEFLEMGGSKTPKDEYPSQFERLFHELG